MNVLRVNFKSNFRQTNRQTSFSSKRSFKTINAPFMRNSFVSFGVSSFSPKNTYFFQSRSYSHGYPEELEPPHFVEKPRCLLTREEVAKHNTKEDCWIIIHGKVYDVSEWILFHPGLDQIATNAGYDSTELFEAVGHQNAVHYMDRFYIGDLVEHQKERRFTCNTPTQNPQDYY